MSRSSLEQEIKESAVVSYHVNQLKCSDLPEMNATFLGVLRLRVEAALFNPEVISQQTRDVEPLLA